jgi:hypothetical protein
MTDPFRHLAGAYVLGALDPDEHASFVEHLRTCASCAAQVADLSALPSALAQLTADDLAELQHEDVAGPVPDTLLPNLVRAVTRRRRRILVSFGAAAAAVVAAVTIAVWPTGGSGEPAGRPMQATQAYTPVRADVRLVARTWGTEVVLHCRYDAHEPTRSEPYRLIVIDRSGHHEEIGTWSLDPGQAAEFHVPTSISRNDIARIELQLTDDTPILTLAE